MNASLCALSLRPPFLYGEYSLCRASLNFSVRSVHECDEAGFHLRAGREFRRLPVPLLLPFAK